MPPDPKQSDRDFTADEAQSNAGEFPQAFDKAAQERIGKLISKAVTQPTKKQKRRPP